MTGVQTCALPIYPNSLTASYTYLRQTAGATFSITAGVYVAAYSRKIEPIEFFRGQLSFKNGLQIVSSADFATRLYGSIELTKPMSTRWSNGIYIQNFTTALKTSDRLAGSAYGLILQYKEPSGNYRMNARMGLSGGKPELRFEGGLGL